MANTTYYRDILKETKTRMCELHRAWEDISKHRATPEHGKCAIHSLLGQTQLLIVKKFDFMDNSINKADEQKDLYVNNEYLQGLWELIYIEVEDLYKKYKDLNSSARNDWRRHTGTKKQTSSKSQEKTSATTQRFFVAKGTLKRSLSRSQCNDTPFGSSNSSFTMSRPTATPSTSSSAKADSAPAPSMIRSKAVDKNPFSDLVEAPILLISDTDDSDALSS